jgi:hypothetical protein
MAQSHIEIRTVNRVGSIMGVLHSIEYWSSLEAFALEQVLV